MYDRVREGTLVTYAARMMREEGYAMSSVMFRYIYRALELMLLVRKLEGARRSTANPQRWRRYQRIHRKGLIRA